MSDEIENAGSKGYCMMYFAIGFLLFIAMVVYIYYSNGDGVPQ